MPVVFIPPLMRELTAGAARIEVEATTVREAIDAIEARHPGVRERLCRGDDLLPGLQVSVNDSLTRRGLDAKLAPNSEVHFLPAYGGG
ncbi:MAG TPA: MoaD/ThiS family protein [Pirellulaceae bacterium]|nr:MoaD/ThiS family protein [Pirellulaceae bacterium]